MVAPLNAVCERCEAPRQVPAERLFDFDPRCPDCSGLLVLHVDASRVLPPDFHDRPTTADSSEHPPLPRPRVAFVSPAPAEPAQEPAEEPVLEGEALDDSSDEVYPDEPLFPPSRERSSALLEAEEGADPYEQAALALDQAMTESVRKTRRARRMGSDSGSLSDSGLSELSESTSGAEVEPHELDGLVEVVQIPVGGTGGRGSRTYERDELLESAASSESPTSAIDLDWLALIEDAPLTGSPDDTVSRVIITLPEEAAPTADASADQVRAFQQAVQKLEDGTSSSLTTLLAPDEEAEARVTQAGQSQDPDTRSWGSETADGKTQPWVRPGEDEEEPPTRSFQREDSQHETTRPWHGGGEEPEAAEDRTQTWEGAPETTPQDPPTASWPAEQKAAEALQQCPPAPEPERSEDALAGTGHSRPLLDQAQLDKALVCARDPDGPYAEAFRQLYQRLFGREDHAPRTLLVTSPRSGDGKTTVAANLALVAAARNGGAVLVDADMHGRGVLRAFGVLSRSEGLLEALQTEGDPTEFMMPFELGGHLDVVPLGIPSSSAGDLLTSSMSDYLTKLGRSLPPSAVVVVDASSTLSSSEAQALAQEVDGVLLVARAGVTPRDEVTRSLDVLGRDRVLGVVLNDAREGS